MELQDASWPDFFRRVLSSIHDLREGARWVVPSDAFMPQVLKYFNLSALEFKRRFKLNAHAFISIWVAVPEEAFVERGKFIRDGMSYKARERDDDLIVVDGWISTQDRNDLILAQPYSPVRPMTPVRKR